MDLELRHLRDLCAVSEAGSLNRAAADLGLPQPALSRQIRRLEELLGGALFERDCRGVQPTVLGSTVLGYAETITQLFDDLGEQVKAHRLRQRRMLRVGWATSALYEPLLHALRRLRPAEDVHIVTVGSSCELTDLLCVGQIDVALRDRMSHEVEPCGDEVAEITLAESPVLLALPALHPLANQPTVAMSDLADQEWISASGPDDCYGFLRGVCEPFGFAPKITYDVPVTGPRDDVIRLQGCVALAQAIRPTATGVTRRPLADLSLRVHHSVAYRKDSLINTYIPALIGLLAAAHRRSALSLLGHDERLCHNGVRPMISSRATELAGINH